MNGSWLPHNWSSLRQGTFTYVTGTFKAPKALGPDGFASVWVGTDGFTCSTAILQTGINVAYSNGVTQYAGMLIRIFKRLSTILMGIFHQLGMSGFQLKQFSGT